MSDPKKHYKLLNDTEYLGAQDLLGRDVTVEILSISKEDVTYKGGAKEKKAIMRFVKGGKRWVVNKTNQGTIAGLYGVYTDEWINKQITLYPTTTKFGRETVDCIRVRDTAPQQNQQPQPPADESDPMFTPDKGNANGGMSLDDERSQIIEQEVRDAELEQQRDEY